MTKYAFVLSEWHRYAGWSSTRKVAETTGASVAELTARLRPWAVEVITRELLDDGEYHVQLVELREDGHHLNGLLVEAQDVFWFYGEEYLPVSPAHA